MTALYEPLPHRAEGTALLLEGGALRTVYTAAVITALVEAGVEMEWIGAVSASTIHMAAYMTRETDLLRTMFTEFPSDPRFGGLRSLLTGQGYFNAEYVYGEGAQPGEPLALDWDRFFAAPTQFRVSAFNASSGEIVHWGREDVLTPQDCLLRARASATLPIVMPPVTVDGDPYVDGMFGPAGGIPLDAAIADGYERFLAVTTRPRRFRKSTGHAAWYLNRTVGKYPHVVDAIIARQDRYNATRARLFELEREGRAYVFAPAALQVNSGDRNPRRLQAAYQSGLIQARREMPAIMHFLGV